MHYYLTIICFFILNCFIACGQQPFTQNYPIEIYKGASQNWYFDQDKQGVIYVANSDGVLRYDGVGWDFISLPNEASIFAIDVDSTDRIYVAPLGDLGYLTRLANGNYEYQSLLLKLPDSSRQHLRIDQVIVFKDKVVFWETDHIYIYSDDQFEVLTIRSDGMFVNNKELYLLKDDRLWKYKNHGFAPWLYLGKKNRMGIIPYSSGSYLILDDQSQVWYIDEKTKTCRIFSDELNKDLKNLKAVSIRRLNNGNIVVGTMTAILIFDSNGKLQNRLEIEIPPYSMRLFEDRQHNLWINVDSNIIQLIASSSLSFYDNKNGLKGIILSLGKNGNHQYVGTSNGIFYLEDRNTFVRLPEASGNVWNFFNFNGKLYACDDFGVLELDEKKVTRVVEQRWTLALCKLKKYPGHMLMSDYNALWILRQKGHSWSKEKIYGFVGAAYQMQEDGNGNIWVSDSSEGIWKIVLNASMDSVVSIAVYGKANGLPSNINNRIFSLGGQVVAATADGIYSYNAGINRFEPEEKYRKAFGKRICIYSLIENAEGDIYFWGAQRNVRETAGALKKQADGSFKLLLTPFNKTAADFNNTRVDVDAPLLVTNSGEVWIGNNQKIINYKPYQKVFYNDSIQLSIQKVWASDSLIYQSASKDSVHTLSFTSNNFRFEFLCSFLEESEKTQYQYKMDGFNNRWSDWTAAREAFFTNLSEGDYTFYVRSKNIYDVISEPVSFTFHINPPWYRTWLAYIAYIVTFAIFVFTVVQFNIRRIKKQKEALKAIVKEKTRDLVNANEELLMQRNLLAEQNHQLYDAKITIENQNREITNRNETLENEVQKRTKELVDYNHQLEEFAFVTAHNLRGPVARILGLGSILKMTTNPSEVKGIGDRLAFCAEEADSVIKDLNVILQIKSTSTQLEEVNLEDSISNVISSLEREICNAGANIQTEFIGTKIIITSKSYLENIVCNLLHNSLKFRHPERSLYVKITSINTSEYKCLIITDNGLGIDMEKHKDKMFTLYGRFHLHIDGKGLGLYQTKTQIVSIGGKIEVESKENVGATFKVFFKV